MKTTKTERWIEEFGEDKIIDAWYKSKNKSGFPYNLGINYANGSTGRFADECKKRFNLTDNHFDVYHKNRKYEQIDKECPICGKTFRVGKGQPKEKQTCSYSCSNKFFRRGRNNGMWSRSAYRSTCFDSHEKKCIICGESNIVAVHHYDFNHNNNDTDNLIPLCPTHHQYIHSSFKYLIEDKVNEYRDNFIRGIAQSG